MKTTCAVITLLVGLTMNVGAADPAELAGRWVGGIDTPKGQMEIALQLTLEKGKLVGTLKTGHGDWDVTEVAEKSGVWTVGFKSPGGPGTLSGRVKDSKFTGDWESPMAKGTFDLTRSKKKE